MSDETTGARRPKGKVLRPPGLAVFAGVLVLVFGLWWLFADRIVERGLERTATAIVGALVELESADVRPAEGSVRLVGLQVTNPNAPMKNLVQADEILADVMVEPLLRKKVVVERLSMTGVRFGTDRETSGAIENPDPAVAESLSRIDSWVNSVELPELSLEGIGNAVVRTEAIDADSLATVRFARATMARADSLRSSWQTSIESLDPRPRIDSLEAVVERLEGFRLTPLNATQVPGLVQTGRQSLSSVTGLASELESLESSVRDGLSTLSLTSETIADLRAQDLAYARGLLRIPSLDAPTISPALFGSTALDWLAPALYWAQAAERFLPPGLDPRNRPGPSRVRAEGTTYDFRQGADYPAFLLQQADLGVVLAGAGAAAGSYTAHLTNLTSSPALLGRPMELSLSREEGVQGPRALSLGAVLDHTGTVLRDSVSLSMSGVELPRVEIDAFGGALDLGPGENAFSLKREGDRIDARMRWASDQVTWADDPGSAPSSSEDAAEIGSAAWARALLRRTLADLGRVELDMGLSGTLTNPSLSVSSNLGGAVADALRRELGQQIEAAEAQLRAEVNGAIDPVLQDARSRVDAATALANDRILGSAAEVEELQARLEARIRSLTGG